MTLDKAYKLGYDCGLNGPNQTNCNYMIFGTLEKTYEWERGKRDAESFKAKHTKGTLKANGFKLNIQ